MQDMDIFQPILIITCLVQPITYRKNIIFCLHFCILKSSKPVVYVKKTQECLWAGWACPPWAAQVMLCVATVRHSCKLARLAEVDGVFSWQSPVGKHNITPKNYN